MELPLADEKIRAIVSHMAHLRAAYPKAFASPVLVEPTGDFFPDEFQLDPESVERLLRRMLGYAPISADLEIGLGFVGEDGEVSGGGCGSGACGTGGLKEIARGGAVETEEGYAALVHVRDVGEPSILTTVLARAAGRIALFEADEEVDPRNEGALSELTALASGLGLLLLNGACVYKKGCGGMKRHQATYLDVEEIAVGLALFVRTTDKKPSAVRRHLEVTQKEAFDTALAFIDGQPTLVRTMIDHPETLADGVFDYEKPKGFFSRLFAPKNDGFEPTAIPVRARERSAEEQRRLAEAKALVDEALAEP